MLRHFAPFIVKPKFNKKILLDLFKVSLPLQIPVYLDLKLLKASIGLIILSYTRRKSTWCVCYGTHIKWLFNDF